MAESSASRRLAAVTLTLTFALVLMGGLVTSNEAGDSFPGWPLAWGQAVPVGHLSGKVVCEYTHRVIAALVAACTVALAVLVLACHRRSATLGLSLAAVAVVVVQALLGGHRVKLGETHSWGVATIHAFTAQVFLGTMTAAFVSLSPRWSTAARGAAPARAWLLPFAAVAAVLLQILLGAGFRHRVFGALPHVMDAALVAVLVALLASTVAAALWSTRE